MSSRGVPAYALRDGRGLRIVPLNSIEFDFYSRKGEGLDEAAIATLAEAMEKSLMMLKAN
jgi:hypothetical protein